MNPTETIICDIVNKDCLVHSILADFSDENKKIIARLQKNISDKFDGLIWETPSQALHVTLLVWTNSWVDSRNQDEVFAEIFPQYDLALEEILLNYSPVKIKFNEIKVTQDAIIIIGKDNGEFQRIRDEFGIEVSMNEKIKQPQIIHATIARFNKECNIEEIDEFLKTQFLSITESINRFKLPRETKKPMMEFEIKKYYELKD